MKEEGKTPLDSGPDETFDGGFLYDGHGSDKDEEPPAMWLLTFGDVTALMLAFFVMLYSMSHMQSEQFEDIIAAMTTRIQQVQEGKPRATAENSVTKIDLLEAFPTGYLEQILRRKMAEDPILDTVRLTGLEDKLILSFPADRLFAASGSAELLQRSEPVLLRLYSIFSQFGNRIEIHAHTMPTPAPAPNSVASRFQDNWSLSLERGLAIARRLTALGLSNDVTLVAMGSSHYDLIDSAISEPRRSALANRIDVVITPEARGQ